MLAQINEIYLRHADTGTPIPEVLNVEVLRFKRKLEEIGLDNFSLRTFEEAIFSEEELKDTLLKYHEDFHLNQEAPE